MGFRYFMAGYWWDYASIFEIINIKTLYAKGPIHGSFTHLFNIKLLLRNSKAVSEWLSSEEDFS